jgi:hypothetical protein
MHPVARTVTLHPHPGTPCPAVDRIILRLHLEPSGLLRLRYELQGDLAKLRVPEQAASRRADELWRHTCLEFFLADAETGEYHEFNFSPSTEWAVYRFSGYRAGMVAAEPWQPRSIEIGRDPKRLTLDAEANLHGLVPKQASPCLRAAVSAVIEAADGSFSYWALAHPPGKPDFHHPDGFRLRLGPSDP